MRDKELVNKWENKELGASDEHVKKVSSDDDEAVSSSLGLQTISIRLPKKLIDDLKYLASDDGIGYQPYVRQLLMKHVRTAKSEHGHHKINTAR